MYKEQKGITLVALVITVIVLLILAGVALSMINSGDANSLFSKSQEARNQWDNSVQKEGEEYTNVMTDFNTYYNQYGPKENNDSQTE